ncbi:hypothetical protein [Flammeovirga sp. OC4]|uniref:hypothetical protein n=1 Tax=Flammeovirga sp. OC4 TaxID=1382345 RepID=UPI0005C5D812|nr:hypothetical protein [Flammeovirga sp. OC4]
MDKIALKVNDVRTFNHFVLSIMEYTSISNLSKLEFETLSYWYEKEMKKMSKEGEVKFKLPSTVARVLHKALPLLKFRNREHLHQDIHLVNLLSEWYNKLDEQLDIFTQKHYHNE